MRDRTHTGPIRVAGATALGVAGVFALAGCGAAAVTTDDVASDGADRLAGHYTDGTYTAEGSYATPDSVETITVTVSLADDIVTDVVVQGDPRRAESVQFQGQFIGGISDEVVGKPLDDIAVSRVAGSSLTSGGFAAALEAIKADAAG